MRLAKYVKAVVDRKRYQIDYSDWLDTGETIQQVIFAVANNTPGNPLVVDSIAVLPDGQSVQYYVSGGENGLTYEINPTMTSVLGQVREDELLMTIRNP